MIALAMYVVGGTVIDQARDDAWQRANDAARNLAMAIARDTANRFALCDESLRQIDARMRLPGLRQLPPALRRLVLFNGTDNRGGIGAALILDPSGKLVDDSAGLPPGQRNFADRDYFRVWEHGGPDGLYVSHVYRSRLADGAPSVALSRKLTSADGRFAGVAMIPVRLSYFEHLLANLNLGTAGAVTLLTADGTILVRAPGGVQWAGTSIANSPNFRLMGPNLSGAYVAPGMVDGIKRLYVYQRIAGYPLVVTVAPSTHDILVNWGKRAAIIGGLIFVLGIAVVAIAMLFSRELMRRESAESKLRALVRTDPLTGVATRREFDTVLDHEWNRATGSGSPLSLLFVDVDYFKRYNDWYGHQAGDAALQTVARALASAGRRPSDLAARYGGEEFVLLLPHTDEAGAARIGERLRRAVEHGATAHADSPYGKLTVSVGVACSSSSDADSPAALVAAADRGLYAAKAAGRNCVIVVSRNGERIWNPQDDVRATHSGSLPPGE